MKSRFTPVAIAVALLFVCARAEGNDSPGARWLARAAEEGLSEVQRKTYGGLAKLHACRVDQLDDADQIDPYCDAAPNVTQELKSLGVDALPYLAEALDDSTPTKTVTQSHQSEKDGKSYSRRIQRAPQASRGLKAARAAGGRRQR